MKEIKKMQEIMKPALELSEKNKEMFEKIKVAAVKQSEPTQAELKKFAERMAESYRNFENPMNKKKPYIENKYTRFFNQYKHYFKERGIITTEVFHEFWTWFTRCLYPDLISLLRADISEYHFKLFHEFKERLLNDMKWDYYKEAHLLDIYDKESNNYWLGRMEVSTEIKNEISKRDYHSLLNQYIKYFGEKKYYESTQEFSVFLIWVAKCLHPDENLENVVITDKDIYQFIEYIDIIQDNYNWSDEEERKRLKEEASKTTQIEIPEKPSPSYAAKYYVLAYILECDAKGIDRLEGQRGRLEAIGKKRTKGKRSGNTFYINFNNIANKIPKGSLDNDAILFKVGGDNWRSIVLELTDEPKLVDKYLKKNGL